MNSNDLGAPQATEAVPDLSRRTKSALQARPCFGLLHRRERWGLSWRGWFAASGLAALLSVLFIFRVYPFLAVTERQPLSDYLIAEGWAPVDVLRGACEEFKAGGYRKIVVSGCVVHDEWTDKPSVTYADWGAYKLRRLGIPEDLIQPVPCLIQKKDRTYCSALAVKQWMGEHGIHPQQINVVTDGAHARRSRLLFQKAFGPEVKVGIIAVADPQFDPDHWWRSSEGVREVVGETIAYLYARLLFHPAAS
jgi:hypothetical protein